ncbi:murinoglobulin-1-like isoform X2 [Dendronephthya gigantea]|uniref:murinoglobulin-1-like isoform X2 n=1 Tax=Dendronephthya gigantea TaxID=151771 RepID=UPI001069F829|nr:murinoglobulin-1-like isoform X2 [Dendronephthya gigantea]
MKSALIFLLFLNLIHIIHGSNSEINDGDYLITVPRVLRGGTTVNIGVNIFGNVSCDVEISLLGRFGINGGAKGHFQPNEIAKLELKVPNEFVQSVRATVGNNTSETKISYEETTPVKIFIQTDKPIYKPGQEVQMRIIYVNSELKPAGKKEPSGSKIMKWTDVELHDGIAGLSLNLSKEPVLGKWKIQATIEGITATKNFEIEKYVLPKFEIKIEFPPYLAKDKKDIPISVCASYTYGKDVTGVLKTQLCLVGNFAASSWWWWTRNIPKLCVTEVKNLTGCQEYDAWKLLIEPNRWNYPYRYLFQYNSYRVRIQAIFTETSTGITRENIATSSSSKRYSKQISFLELPKKFKPGLPFRFEIKISYLDGKPVTDGDVLLSISGKRFYNRAYKTLMIKNYSVKKGLIAVSFEDMPHDTEYLSLRATYGIISSFAYSNAWYSPSLSYLQLIKSQRSPTKIGSQGALKVSYTVRYDAAKITSFHHTIMCKGNLVSTGVTKIRLNSLHSNKTLEHSSPPPITTLGPFIHPFTTISAPAVKEFEIKFNITQQMVPSCRILVYYVRPDRETVGDSIVYDIEDRLENQVSVDFAEKQKRPGEKTKMIIKAKPGSRIAISALDKSVLLLRNANDLKKSEVMGILNRQDVSPIERYLGNCDNYWSKPFIGDASEAFNMAGVVFLSNLNVFTQPCRRGHLKTTIRTFFVTVPPKMTTRPPEVVTEFPEVVTEAPEVFTEAPEVATAPPVVFTEAPEVFTDAPEVVTEAPEVVTEVLHPTTRLPKRKQKPIKKVEVRKDFPETWLWRDVKLNDTSEMQVMEVEIPDTITTWVAKGFAMSSVYGMGISDKTRLKAFQPFFIQMNLPYSVIRGEEIPITVTIFNYLSSCVPLKLELNRETKDYRVTSFYINKLCVCGDDGISVKFKIIPKKVGNIAIKVTAITSEARLCPKSTIYAADAVKRNLLVEPEGIQQDYTEGIYFCAENDPKNEMIDLVLPEIVIPGSVLPQLSVVGDIMGPALSNLDGLLRMPYGCGEQNMAKFAPNIYIMDYLTNTDQVTSKIKDSAIHYMNSGYQRELRYKRRSGSYSAFGNSDKYGSMMLTAFVVRSYARAQRFIFIDEADITHSINWFSTKQRSSGCFPSYGRLFDRSLQGGVNSELTITAYVTIALLEAGIGVETKMVSKALDCITKELDNDVHDSYTTSLITYTLTLANHSMVGIMMDRLDKKAISKDDQLFWSRSNVQRGSRSGDVEMTGYALLSYLRREDFFVAKLNAVKIVRWLSKQRNGFGGFSSTQDTCVALQALSEFAQKTYHGDSSLNLRISTNIGDIFGHDFQLTGDNKFILQRVEIPSDALPNQMNVTASGSGCALFQASVKYNIPVPKKPPAFKVEVSVHRREATADEETTTCYPLQLKIFAEWLKEDVSNMAIVDVKLVSGFTANEESLQEKLEQGNRVTEGESAILKRYEIEGQNIILYFDEIKTMHFSLDIIQSTLVKKTKPGVVRVYDYYSPESEGKVMYNITEEDCYGERIRNECPKCLSVDNFEDFFDKNINCSTYLTRVKSINGRMKVKKAYIKTKKTQNRKLSSYEIPEFCPCDEIYNGVTSLVIGLSDYFQTKDDKTSIVFNAATTVAKWNGQRMKKIFREKMISKIYRRCKALAMKRKSG